MMCVLIILIIEHTTCIIIEYYTVIWKIKDIEIKINNGTYGEQKREVSGAELVVESSILNNRVDILNKYM